MLLSIHLLKSTPGPPISMQGQESIHSEHHQVQCPTRPPHHQQNLQTKHLKHEKPNLKK